MRDISLHILDIMQNSTAAKASMIKLNILTKSETGMLEVTIEDNGCGMDSELLARVTDPFSTTRTTRKVGLGIPLFKASAEQSGGRFDITSQKGVGTAVKAVFAIANIDRPPIGDLEGVITDMAAANPEVEIQLRLENGSRQFVFNSREASQALGEVPLSEFTVVQWLRKYIKEGLSDIFGGVLSEIDS
ncbi:MAG: ATP-binding protein [Clostridiaceae bacterium]